ncbi:type VI secretion system baseplate subunit TssF [Arcobacter sp. LA11]|uniref:type VI secretion system baseplate subunit TssF n=1 Tax=Arcobacter sp. LA11 TaxID=1898176 RepID=UPI000932AEFC|nr:type VI secretion system baseplate subunit TssF [Arcobacter sp. LA11]
MAFNDYYKEELTSLRTFGAEFSKKNPGLSTYLSKEGQDPDVERLLEGFSFLTGRLKQQLDQELPEVAHTLVQLLWPNYIRPIPSYSIIQYSPIKNSVNNIKIKKDTEVLSKNNSDSLQCKFRTTYDTIVMPLELADVNYFIHGKKSSLELKMNMTTSGTLADLVFNNLRMYLSGSKFIAQDLYLFLTNYIEEIEISLEDEEDKSISDFHIDKKSIMPVGFNSLETMTPYPLNVFDGYILLQEFFCFKDKYLFVDVMNLNKISDISDEILSKSRSFTIKIHFSKRFIHAETLKKEHFSLYCTPIINLFETDTVPIRKNQEQDEFLIVPSELDKNHSEIFSIEKVRGWIPSKNIYQDYLPFESFEHLDDDNEYYSSRIKLSIDGERTNTYLRFASTDTQNSLIKTNATVSVKILCTNRDLPSTLLLGDICVANALSNSENLSFKNITIPSVSYPPPIAGDFLWRIISNMSLNYLSLDNIKSFRTILETYDFYGAFNIKQKEKTIMNLKGLEDISYKTCEMIDKGLPIRGIHVSLKIDPNKFSCVGEAYLFCSILNEFLALYSNINSFHKLTVDMQNKEIYEWPAKLGSQNLI